MAAEAVDVAKEAAMAAKQAKQQRLREQFKASIHKVISLVKGRLTLLELKGKRVECPQAAPPELLKELHDSLRALDDKYDPKYTLMPELRKIPTIQAYLTDSEHTFDTTYMLSFQDCDAKDCKFGCCGWDGVPAKELLRCKPVLPMLNPNAPGHMYSYDEAVALACGTSERNLPSKRGLGNAEVQRRKEKDKKKELHPSKVRAVTCCDECGRPRCIYAKLKPSELQLKRLDGYLESINYTCGDALFPKLVEGGDEKLAQMFYNAEAITCLDKMELNYFNYGGLRGREEFEHVCARCGNAPEESQLIDKAKLAAAVTQGKVALPLCTDCFDAKVGPVLVGRSDKVTEDLGRKERKEEVKREALVQREAKEVAGKKPKGGKAKEVAPKKAAGVQKQKPPSPKKGGSIKSFFSRGGSAGGGTDGGAKPTSGEVGSSSAAGMATKKAADEDSDASDADATKLAPSNKRKQPLRLSPMAKRRKTGEQAVQELRLTKAWPSGFHFNCLAFSIMCWMSHVSSCHVGPVVPVCPCQLSGKPRTRDPLACAAKQSVSGHDV